jgi:hypothetical protein
MIPTRKQNINNNYMVSHTIMYNVIYYYEPCHGGRQGGARADDGGEEWLHGCTGYGK